MKGNYPIYLAVMALTTYAVRALPFTAFAGKIKSRFFRSFLYYVPYAVLTAMTLPAILYSTGNIVSAAVGLAVAVVLSIMEKDLMTVALFSCIGVYIAEWLI
ncbi:MAG: AzlD domain-containing protein [Lachnospiraceae bacterium]|jgi:branched-subunit amino acid transport protein|nr:AzlD domain-containing protein [Lachnospiraceae bacterium]MBQ3912467.1 AzlD domain-containing protein [Lachnospiraceae bacterium]